MAKFQYRMQNILNIKMKLEVQAKNAYGIANGKYQEEQKKLQTLMLRRMEYEQKLKELVNVRSGIPTCPRLLLKIMYMKSAKKHS